jgi:hypothetical protein
VQRHIFRSNGVIVRMKLKYGTGRYANFYRVARPDGAIGWQMRRPPGFVDVPMSAPLIRSIAATPGNPSIGRRTRRIATRSAACVWAPSASAGPVMGCRMAASGMLPAATW